ncbi:MAG TPA: hypothetical protein VJ417_06795, partial [Candidatus Glassbacteria bacterium]|nr:hypothetical protein [Candidatus Glassbacteria bacterium]
MTGSENNKRDIFRNRMLEASFLSNTDPRRVEIERLVSGEESWAAEEWARLVEENDRWRGELCGVNVPAKLEENLLAIAAGRGSAVSF